MAKSKFFRVAVEGATTDGRTMERRWISDIAASYNPNTYGARIFMEHMRGWLPEGPFKAYGDVTAVKAEEITDGALKGKLALFAQIEPTPDMVALAKAKQKIYSSIEVNPKFADTGRAYLVGLGITDSPASLGTEVLEFAAKHPSASPFAARKQDADNLFTAADAVEIEFEDEPSTESGASLFATIREKLAKIAGKTKHHDAQFTEIGDALNGLVETLGQFADSQNATTQTFADEVAALGARIDALDAANAQRDSRFAALTATLDASPATPFRQLNSGGTGTAQTDC